VAQLPDANRVVLHFLLDFFTRVTEHPENKVSSPGIVFAPTRFPADERQ
jgi:hypothetical protein